MGYQYLGQSFDHALVPLKAWPSPVAVDFNAVLSPNVNIAGTGQPPLSGMCVHYTSVGFEMGAKLNQMPLFLWPSQNDLDVTNFGVPAGVAAGGTSSNPPAWIAIRPTGMLNALVAIGGYELETTEFDTAQTYAPNDFLRAVTSNTDANAGKLTNQDASGGVGFATSSAAVWGNPAATNWESIVGVVSRGAYTNANGRSVIAFWPVYLPGTR